MIGCHFCLAEHVSGPCPHDAMRAVQAYGRAEYARGLRAGLDVAFHLLAVIAARQERGERRGPVPIGVVRQALSTSVGDILRSAEKAGLAEHAAWQAEARAAFEVNQ